MIKANSLTSEGDFNVWFHVTSEDRRQPRYHWWVPWQHDDFHRWAIGVRPRVSWSHCFFWLSFLTFSHIFSHFLTFSHIFSQFHFLWKAVENGCMALHGTEDHRACSGATLWPKTGSRICLSDPSGVAGAWRMRQWWMDAETCWLILYR